MASLFIIQGDKSIHPLLRKLPGLLFITLMTAGFLQLAALPSVAHMGLGSLTLAMVGGALIGNTLYPRLQRYCDEGVNWSKHHLLRLGIVLYGFRLSLQQALLNK
ncbi:MAG: putative sulfate exporter family transporter [Candidatus Symbiopectobacterium sp. Dall1.0]|nr:putative sulfate exporter family transporter [Candidatus Symbiopectobacterium sp. Dall1.0]